MAELRVEDTKREKHGGAVMQYEDVIRGDTSREYRGRRKYGGGGYGKTGKEAKQNNKVAKAKEEASIKGMVQQNGDKGMRKVHLLNYC